MNNLNLTHFKKLAIAEEYLDYFGIEYEPQFVNVNRLHILKKFSELIAAVDADFPDLGEAERLVKYGEALQEAYEVFLSASPLQTKLFKVFQQKPNNVVMLNELAG